MSSLAVLINSFNLLGILSIGLSINGSVTFENNLEQKQTNCNKYTLYKICHKLPPFYCKPVVYLLTSLKFTILQQNIDWCIIFYYSH